MSLLCSSTLPCSPSPIDVDVRALFKAAGSLMRLTLAVGDCTSEALAEVFDHNRPLEELDLTLDCAEVSSACSPGI